MSDDLKTLKVDDKWSILYDAGKNDRPLEWHRHKKLHTPFSEYNADVAMFYAFQEATDRIEALTDLNKKLTLKVSHYSDLLDDQLGTPCEQIRHKQEIEALEAKLAEAVEALQFYRSAVNLRIDCEITHAMQEAHTNAEAFIAKIKGDQL